MTVFSKFTTANVKAILTLDPLVQPLFLEFLWRIAMSGIYIRITAARRSEQEQHREFLKGRPWLVGGKPGAIFTKADWDNSYHVFGLAVDIAPLWNIGNLEFKAWYSDKAINQLAKIASDIGIEHPIDGDGPHFQYTDGLSISDLKAGKKPKPPHFEHVIKSLPVQRVIQRLKNKNVLPLTSSSPFA